jgi:hypothetical protein
MKLPVLPQDKANHFVYGFLIFCMFNFFLNSYYSLLIVFAIAVIKEIIDKISGKGTPEVLDVVATIAPALILILNQL